MAKKLRALSLGDKKIKVEEVSSLALFIRDKETIQNIHSVLSHWLLILHITSLPNKTPEASKRGNLGFNEHEECVFTTSNMVFWRNRK